MISIILNAAKAAKVSGVLLLAICSHESANFTLNYAPHDHGSPSYGSCQVKADTAWALGFSGKVEDLNKPEVNAKYAALYLAYQQDRYEKEYGENWVVLTAAYNAGTYHPSSKVVGCPKNLKYINFVKNHLPEEYKNKLTCGVNK